MNTTNPYIQTLQEKGYSIKECSTPSKVQHTYPREIHGVVFQTEEEYNEALHEFLNGNWTMITKKQIEQELAVLRAERTQLEVKLTNVNRCIEELSYQRNRIDIEQIPERY